MNTEIPLIIDVKDGRVSIDVCSERLNGITNQDDVNKFTNEFIDNINQGCDFRMVCSPDCPNSCYECVNAILRIVKEQDAS
jgi:hypothetical protein